MQRPRAEGEAKMQVDIQDDAENWRRWGDLVRSWIFNPNTRPETTADMQSQMNDNNIAGQVPGPVRKVKFVDYDDDKLYISLPSTTMVLNDESDLNAIAGRPPGQRKYPLPNFYAIAFGGAAAEADLSGSEMLAFGRRRLGEYTIQECQ
jgi:hypothetical protein